MEIADYIIADDRVLVELVLQGDNIAFEYLFERYKEAIHRLFIQRTNNPLDADDLLQETFIKVYINIHRYNPAYTFGQWVYTIARNTFVDFIRRRQEDLPIDDKFTAPAWTDILLWLSAPGKRGWEYLKSAECQKFPNAWRRRRRCRSSR